MKTQEAIKYTTQGDYACSYCGYLIPTKKNVLQDWISAFVKGMFCSQTCAEGAGNDLNYQAKFSH